MKTTTLRLTVALFAVAGWNGATVTSAAADRGPMLHPRLPGRVTAVLNVALPLAREQLRSHPSCRALFDHFGADGVAKLDDTSYYPAGRQQESRYCHGSSHAVTEVGGSAVVLCRSFGGLSAEEAAILLIHEALHFAGQSEYPIDPGAPDSIEITRMVMEGCRLS
jgi:hypothetical protein